MKPSRLVFVAGGTGYMVQARAEAEVAIRAAGLNATFVRPWYVLGPGHRWPYLFLPVYRLLQLIPPTRDIARRLYPVSLEQMTAALVGAVDNPPAGIRIVETPEILRARSRSDHGMEKRRLHDLDGEGEARSQRDP